MSSDGESIVVVAGSSAEDIVQRKKVKRSSVWEHFQEKDDAKAHCHHESKTKYAHTTDLLRHSKHMHPNVSTCTRKWNWIDIKFVAYTKWYAKDC